MKYRKNTIRAKRNRKRNRTRGGGKNERDAYNALGFGDLDVIDDKELSRKYKKMALQFHPDKNKEHDTTSQFQQINNAKDVLENAILRRGTGSYNLTPQAQPQARPFASSSNQYRAPPQARPFASSSNQYRAPPQRAPPQAPPPRSTERKPRTPPKKTAKRPKGPLSHYGMNFTMNSLKPDNWSL